MAQQFTELPTSRERSGAYTPGLLFLGANLGFFFFSTQFLQGVFGFSAS